jgi:hypothetical protein
MQSCRSFGEPCRYCGSDEIIIVPSQYAGKCAGCSWEALEGRNFIERMVATARRAAAQKSDHGFGAAQRRMKVTPIVKTGRFAFPSLFGEKRRINLPKPIAPMPEAPVAKVAGGDAHVPAVDLTPPRRPFIPRVVASRDG